MAEKAEAPREREAPVDPRKAALLAEREHLSHCKPTQYVEDRLKAIEDEMK